MVAIAAFGKAVDFKSIVVATALDLTMLPFLVFCDIKLIQLTIF
jgi:hypothetical protein